ncbi:protein transport protein Sec24-like At3g07100 [Zingiber officinale]|uniref:protein transport protein Sec24-like At3g07100 n=1 Tax=Zingiber officinale TaxID=94328 RepID=UPI001C4B894A|nr:protein transport protein Sec24-like At3g07100 [Zingiber officinale]XP_042431797.1 protein transport protein Sec24-like At3g07100 [Zingiber officinale]XP_042431798.1 protein transport protein Sec24-like At3g07100 [Zingiber officinale]XP_042431799.1 protein transport protein Sec24-like At3g07100 [Zingiber officinale]XP_042431800.1 protein transport protein Sec24-like At3g07100 [Zingiber officinale]
MEQTTVPGRPTSSFPTAPQFSSPFRSSGPIVGLDGSVPSRAPTPIASSGPVADFGSSVTPQTTSPFFSSGPPIGMQPSHFRVPPPSIRSNGPSGPPSYPAQDVSSYQQMQAPRYYPVAQPSAPLGSSPFIHQPRGPPPTGSFQPLSQTPAVSMGPMQSSSQMVPRSNVPQLSEPSFTTTKIPSQPPLHAYSNVPPRPSMPSFQPDTQFHASRPVSQPPMQGVPPAHVPATHPSYYSHQSIVPPPPPVGGSLGYSSRDQLQHPMTAPPIGGVQGLVEEFQSLSIGSVPGSLNPGVDTNLLPRPLSGDEVSTKIPEIYPMNCHPRFFRLTTHALPNSQSLFSRWHLPLGAVVHPLAETPDGEEVPVINFGPVGIIRCRRCRTYVNPYVTFTDVGRKWRCNLCSLLNDVPMEYYCALDANGRRCDIDQRPELCKGSVDFVASTEYMVRPPMPPLYFFLIDVSVSAVRSGLLEIVAKTIKSCLDDLPGFPRTQIGFITFDSTLHFHNLKSSLTQPQMLVVADLDDIFLPLPDDLLVNLSESRHVVEAFLDSLPVMFQGSANVESALGPALKASLMVMSQLGGKLLIFQSTLPSLGVGRLRLRGDDLRVYGTDKEHPLRLPEDSFYKQMAAELTKNQIAVDIYAFSEKYTDIASLGSLAKYTGGQVYHYPSFQVALHREKLSYELGRNLRRETAWESVMRIRCGKGVRFTSYHGHFMLRSADLLALPAVDCDKAFAMQLALEENLLTTQTVYFQVALLYTSSSGERRIRVHTAAAPVVTDLHEMYNQADTGAIVALLGRIAIESSLSQKLEDARQSIHLKLVKSLKEYRNLFAVQHRLSGRLIYPESLRLLPLYVLALCKSVALRGGYADAPLDDRCAAGYNMMILPVARMLKLLYPSLFRINENLLKDSKESEESLIQLPLTALNLDPKGIYILDDGFNFIIWLGRMPQSDLVNNILGVDFASISDLSKVVVSEHENPISKKLMRILNQLREKNRSSYPSCRLVRQGEQPRELSLFLTNLIEDPTAGSSSYVDWILQLHRQAQS